MSIDKANFNALEKTIQNSRNKQKGEIETQLREKLKWFNAAVEREEYLSNRINEIEETLDSRGQEIEALQSTYNSAMFRDDSSAMESAKATRVDVDATILKLEKELDKLRQEAGNSDFDSVAEGEDILEDVRESKRMIAGDVRARCLSEDIERLFQEVDTAVRDQKLAAVKERRAS
jgi:predicted AlkP superfamily phosphohydrolase/phosphomutase